jgi:hypothetical protein
LPWFSRLYVAVFFSFGILVKEKLSRCLEYALLFFVALTALRLRDLLPNVVRNQQVVRRLNAVFQFLLPFVIELAGGAAL